MRDSVDAWTPYYEELDTQKRRALLDELLRTAPDDGANELRGRLFAERYVKRGGVVTDDYLIRFLMLKNLYAQRRGLFSSFRRDLPRELAALRLNEADALSDAEESALYREYRNAARRYLDASRSDQYGRKLLGFVSASADEKLERAVADLWCISRGVALASGRERQMRLFCDALYDELCAFDVRCGTLYDACEAEYFS